MPGRRTDSSPPRRPRAPRLQPSARSREVPRRLPRARHQRRARISTRASFHVPLHARLLVVDEKRLGSSSRRDYGVSRRMSQEAAPRRMGCWGHVTPLQEAIDRLRLEVEELRASRKRLVAAADADRRRIERELHDGVQQHLSRSRSTSSYSASWPTRIRRRRRCSWTRWRATWRSRSTRPRRSRRRSTRRSSTRAASRSPYARRKTGLGRPRAGRELPTRVSRGGLLVLHRSARSVGDGERATITVREQEGAIDFEVVRESDLPDAALDRLRDRVEALDGTLTIESGPAAARASRADSRVLSALGQVEDDGLDALVDIVSHVARA